MPKVAKSDLVAIVLLVAAVSGLFAYSVEMRRPWFGTNPLCLETWLNTGTMLWAKHWLHEGPFHLWFGYFWDPNSIEFPTLESRTIYMSYPPGAVLPIYLLCKVLHRDPTISTIMAAGLFCHFVVALLLALMTFALARKARAGRIDAVVVSLIPAGLALFLPSPISQFQMAYFHMAVLPAFVLCVSLEMLRDAAIDPRVRRWIGVVQGGVLFFGMLCDWLFAFVTVCLFLKRLAAGQILSCAHTTWKRRAWLFVKNSLALGLAPGLALSLFGLQLWRFHQFTILAERFEERSAPLSSGGGWFTWLDNYLLGMHMQRGYGPWCRWLILASLIGLAVAAVFAGYRCVRRRPAIPALNTGVSLLFLLLTPCLLHVYVLRQDNAHFLHFFTSAKFSIPIAAIPLALLPITIIAGLNLEVSSFSVVRIWRRMRPCTCGAGALEPSNGSLLVLLLLIVAGYYAYSEAPGIAKCFFPPSRDWTRFGAFVSENTRYEDVLFTPNSLLAVNSTPMQLAHTMKCVYVADSLETAYAKLKGVPGEYVVNYLAYRKDLENLNANMKDLMARACEIRSCDEWVLHKIRKPDFLAQCQSKGIGTAVVQ